MILFIVVCLQVCVTFSHSHTAAGNSFSQRGLRGAELSGREERRSLGWNRYYDGGPTGMDDFALHCEVQLLAASHDGGVSGDAFAAFIFDYCENSAFPGDSCKRGDFWSLDERLQKLFVSSICIGDQKERKMCLGMLRDKRSELAYTDGILKLCETTFSFLKPSNILSSQVQRRSKPFKKKKQPKMKRSSLKQLVSSQSAPTSAPSTKSTSSSLSFERDSFESSPTPLPTLYLPPTYIEGVILPGVFLEEKTDMKRSEPMSLGVSLGFGATILLALLSTVLLFLLVRNHSKWHDGSEGHYGSSEASNLSTRSFPSKENNFNHGRGRKLPSSEQYGRIEPGIDTQQWLGLNQAMKRFVDKVCEQWEFRVGNKEEMHPTSTEAPSMQREEIVDEPTIAEHHTSTKMPDDVYLNEFRQSLSSSFGDTEADTMKNRTADSEDVRDGESNLADSVEDIAVDGGHERDDETAPSGVSHLRSQFEPGNSEHNSCSSKVSSQRTVRDLVGNFQANEKERVESKESTSVKSIRNQFEPPSRRDKKRTTEEMSNFLLQLRKNFE